MYRQFQGQMYGNYKHFENRNLLDMKQGDVTGDGIIDKVYLYGNKTEGTGLFADNITLVIEDGSSNK